MSEAFTVSSSIVKLLFVMQLFYFKGTEMSTLFVSIYYCLNPGWQNDGYYPYSSSSSITYSSSSSFYIWLLFCNIVPKANGRPKVAEPRALGELDSFIDCSLCAFLSILDSIRVRYYVVFTAIHPFLLNGFRLLLGGNCEKCFSFISNL